MGNVNRDTRQETNSKRLSSQISAGAALSQSPATHTPSPAMPQSAAHFDPAGPVAQTASDSIIQELASIKAEIEATVLEAKARLLRQAHLELRSFLSDVVSRSEGFMFSRGSTSIQAAQVPDLPLGAIDQLVPPEDVEAAPIEEQRELLTPIVPQPAATHAPVPTMEQQIFVAGWDTPQEDNLDPHPDEAPQASQELPSQQDAGGLCEGTVKLNVRTADGKTGRLLEFVNGLSRKSQVRPLRMVGDHHLGLDIWLALREPLCPEQMLLGMDCVSEVARQPGRGHDQEWQFSVWLADSPAPHTQIAC